MYDCMTLFYNSIIKFTNLLVLYDFIMYVPSTQFINKKLNFIS